MDDRSLELARGNYNVISSFVGSLPASETPDKYFGEQFLVDDVYTAKQLQSNTLWARTTPGSSYGPDGPYYIVGQRTLAPSKETFGQATAKLLLFGASEANRGLAQITVWDDQLQVAQEAAGRIGSSDFAYDQETLKSMFDQDSMKLRVTASNCPLRTQNTSFWLNGPYISSRKLLKLVSERGMQAQANSSQPEQTRIDDTTLAEFDVPTHLNMLAVAFGQVDTLHEILEAQKTAPSTASLGESATQASVQIENPQQER